MFSDLRHPNFSEAVFFLAFNSNFDRSLFTYHWDDHMYVQKVDKDDYQLTITIFYLVHKLSRI